MLDKLVINASGNRDAYIVNPPQNIVMVTGITGESVVTVYDRKNRAAAVGCFSNARGSEEFEKMLRGFAGAEASGLEVKLIGKAHGKSVRIDVPEDRLYPIVAFESIGVPTARIKELHLAYNKQADIEFDIRTGKLRIMRHLARQVPEEVHDTPEIDQTGAYYPPEPDENESHDPTDPPKWYYPLEPDEAAGGGV
ncbi:hypothetical protein HYY73_05770 [Candidatus Woesearchaeota archaeon]|nr:hypothetical protein [Candidatus Woesearchaeota archaeon]